MIKSKDFHETMYPIVGYPQYAISRTGRIGKRRGSYKMGEQHFKWMQPFIKEHRIYIKLRNLIGEQKTFQVARLIINSKYGELPFDIKYLDGNSLNIDSKNLIYNPDSYKVIKSDDPNTIFITDEVHPAIEFKMVRTDVPIQGNRYYINNKGSIYDINSKRFLSRNSDGSYGYRVTFMTYDHRQVFDDLVNIIINTWMNSDGADNEFYTYKDNNPYNVSVDNISKNNCRLAAYNKLVENVLTNNSIKYDDYEIGEQEYIDELISLVVMNLTFDKIARILNIPIDKPTSAEYIALHNAYKALTNPTIYEEISKLMKE